MRIATWNVNGLRARLDFVRHWLSARKPDVVCLQELKLTEEQFPRDELKELGYEAAVHGQKAWNGVAVLSRLPLDDVQPGLPGQDELGARVVSAVTGDIRFTSVYVPNGKRIDHEDFPRKLDWLDALAEHFPAENPADAPAVLAGDFNVCPAPLDSWNEKKLAGSIFHTDEERARIAALADAGLHDLFRAVHPEEPGYSWWDYRAGAFHRGWGLRIDLLLGTKPVRDRLEAAQVDRDYRKKKEGLTASDHAPVIAELAD